MIFVTVGTTKFDELIKEMDKIAPALKEKVVIQIGRSAYKPKNCEYFDFKTDLSRYFKDADIIISHGGAGTTFEVLGLNKKLISIENTNVLDSHQWDLLSQLAKDKHLIWCKNISKIKEYIKLAKKFKYKKYVPPKCTIDKEIVEFLK